MRVVNQVDSDFGLAVGEVAVRPIVAVLELIRVIDAELFLKTVDMVNLFDLIVGIFTVVPQAAVLSIQATRHLVAEILGSASVQRTYLRKKKRYEW